MSLGFQSQAGEWAGAVVLAALLALECSQSDSWLCPLGQSLPYQLLETSQPSRSLTGHTNSVESVTLLPGWADFGEWE